MGQNDRDSWKDLGEVEELISYIVSIKKSLSKQKGDTISNRSKETLSKYFNLVYLTIKNITSKFKNKYSHVPWSKLETNCSQFRNLGVLNSDDKFLSIANMIIENEQLLKECRMFRRSEGISQTTEYKYSTSTRNSIRTTKKR